MRPYGRIFFRGFSQGIPGPHRSRGRGLRPLSFAAIGTRAKGRTVTGRLEKLAQEGLRGNRDRLAVDACVLHARQVGSRGPRDRRPLRRSVRMYDNSMHRNRPAFQKRIVLSWRRERYCFTNRWREL